MAQITEDLKSGHTVKEDRGALTVTRVFYVTGLVQPPALQVIEALEDPGIPPFGTPYPLGDPSAFPKYDQITVKVRDGEPYGKNAVKVTLTYNNVSRSTFQSQEPPVDGVGNPVNDGPDLKRVSSSFTEIPTAIDRVDLPMILDPPPSRAGRKPYLSWANVTVPAGELVFSRVERSPPAQRFRDLVGTVNNALIGAYPQNTLMLVSIEAEGQDGELWDVEYTFRYQQQGWFHTDIWRAGDGKPPDDAQQKTFAVIAETDFSVLDLDFSDTQDPL